MIIQAQNQFTLQWTLTDINGVPINSAVLTAVIYQERNLSNPNAFPGVAIVNAISLPYVTGSNGQYAASQPVVINPVPLADGLYPAYTLVLDATLGGTPDYHHEEPILVLGGGVGANPIDLTTLTAVKEEIPVNSSNTTVNTILQDYITAFSQAVLNELGYKSMSQPMSVTETRDGNGNMQLFTRQRPIINVAVLTISGVAIPQAGAWPSAGFYISDDQKSIKLRNPQFPISYNYYPNYKMPQAGFVRDFGNVFIQYWAGFNNVPSDVEIVARKMVAIQYGRRQTRDMKTQGTMSQGVSATTQYRDWKVPPELDCMLNYYRRLAPIG